MGPIALFDKSFLQSLSVDESVWFGHFFLPVVCPLFYVETLADLEKAVREGRTPEREVGIIAAKFPEQSAYPCVHHASLVVQDLLGNRVPMDGRVPMSGGRPVVVDGRHGVVYDESPEAEAFARWQRGRFLEVERDMARQWRAALRDIDLKSIAQALRDIGVDASTCRSLQDARDMAQAAVASVANPFARLAMVMIFLQVPQEYQAAIAQRWAVAGYGPLIDHAPYAAHVLSVELFFQFAIAAHLIGAERPTNRVDIAYLNYLPFTMIFVSGDDLHRRCAPLFLRGSQEFVWASDLKHDLGRINQYFMRLPEEEKARGILAFAKAPPKLDGSCVVRMREKFLRSGYDDQARAAPPPVNDERSRKMVEDLKKWTKAPTANLDARPVSDADLQMVSLERLVRRKKGSWYQVPKDLKNDAEDGE